MTHLKNPVIIISLCEDIAMKVGFSHLTDPVPCLSVTTKEKLGA